jgi:methylenetetrahydrofolate dehydrogenase (NADP+)/methenyltetrahydrofolate cyclohydrolase
VAARILDGKAIAEALRAETAAEVADWSARTERRPGLAVVLVGEDPASQVYVRNKRTACRAAGIAATLHQLPAETREAVLIDLVDGLNADPGVHGILVQLPLPRQIREDRVIEQIDPRKDVDGFHPENAGRLAIGRPRFVPCTPLGIGELLKRAGIATTGAHAVVIGRSNVVGKPMALLLMRKGEGGDATVTVAHTATRDPATLARQADILVVAAGRPEMVRGSWIKPGATVIDVGIHRRPEGGLCGDVHFAEAAEVAGAITPVPGGVGPLTVAMLLRNTLLAARLQHAEGPR